MSENDVPMEVIDRYRELQLAITNKRKELRVLEAEKDELIRQYKNIFPSMLLNYRHTKPPTIKCYPKADPDAFLLFTTLREAWETIFPTEPKRFLNWRDTPLAASMKGWVFEKYTEGGAHEGNPTE
jgi:hypothetical protein